MILKRYRFPNVVMTVIILAGILAFFIWIYQNRVLGDATIVVYYQGVSTELDPQSPYYRKLQLACEEMLVSAESLYLVGEELSSIDPETIREQEWVVELTYANSIEVTIPLGIGPTTALPTPIMVTQYLIPLTGEVSRVEAIGVRSFETGKKNYVGLLFNPPIMLGDYKWPGMIGTIKELKEIEDILKQLTNNP